jgi:hypothetical protein
MRALVSLDVFETDQRPARSATQLPAVEAAIGPGPNELDDSGKTTTEIAQAWQQRNNRPHQTPLLPNQFANSLRATAFLEAPTRLSSQGEKLDRIAGLALHN